MNNSKRTTKYKIEPIVAAIAINNFLNVVQDLASLNILNNRRDLKADIAVNDPFDTF